MLIFITIAARQGSCFPPLPKNLPLFRFFGPSFASVFVSSTDSCPVGVVFGWESRSIRDPSSDLERVSRPMYRLLSPDIGIGRLGENSFLVGTNSVCGKPTSMKFIFRNLNKFQMHDHSKRSVHLVS